MACDMIFLSSIDLESSVQRVCWRIDVGAVTIVANGIDFGYLSGAHNE